MGMMVRPLLLVLAIVLAALGSYFLWLITPALPAEERVFNFVLVFGVVGTLLLTVGLMALTVWLASQQQKQGAEQTGVLRRLVTRAELEPEITVAFVTGDKTSGDSLEVRPDWTEREEPGVIAKVSSAGLLMPSSTRYRPASDLQEVRVTVGNDGIVPATGVLVTFLLPAGVEAFEGSEFYTTSSFPLLTSSLPTPQRNSWGLDVPYVDDYEPDGERYDRSRFEFGANELGNNRLFEPGAVWLRFPRTNVPHTYEIVSNIVADGIEPRTKTLTVKVLPT